MPGFIGNRLQHAMWREALHLIENGIATPEDVDLVVSQTFGLRLPAVGPCANMDLVGLPLVAQVQSYLLADLSNASGVLPAVRERLGAGHLGMRTRTRLLRLDEPRPRRGGVAPRSADREPVEIPSNTRQPRSLIVDRIRGAASETGQPRHRDQTRRVSRFRCR